MHHSAINRDVLTVGRESIVHGRPLCSSPPIPARLDSKSSMTYFAVIHGMGGGFMKIVRGIAILSIGMTVAVGCHKDQLTGTALASGIEGQVYRVDAPAVRIGWTPPPFEHVATILVLTPRGDTIRVAVTDSLGRFEILLPSGEYFLRVKESPLPIRTGPFTVPAEGMIRADADYDGGIR